MREIRQFIANTPTTALASSGPSFDMVGKRQLIVTMDANITDMTPAIDPTIDCQPLEIIFIQGATAYTATLDSDKFQSGLDSVIPSPLLNTSIFTRSHYFFEWNATDSKYDFIGMSRRYP